MQSFYTLDHFITFQPVNIFKRAHANAASNRATDVQTVVELKTFYQVGTLACSGPATILS